jgi:uncharacterized protein YeaO (DUF488 family)
MFFSDFVMVLIKMKRAYEPASRSDGYRILVDRLWPRGVSHEKAALNIWVKEIAPTDKLRQWFHKDPEKRWTEFNKRYSAELSDNHYLKQLRQLVKSKKVVTLVYSSKSEKNNATVLARRLAR